VATRTVKTTMVYTHVLEPWNGLRPPVRVRRGRQHGTIDHRRPHNKNFSTPPLWGVPGLRSPASRFRRVGLNKS